MALQALALGAFPWVSLILAGTFCAYGVVRKRAAAPAQAGLLVECMLLVVPAVAYLAWLALSPGGSVAVARGPTAAGLLALTGPGTVIPLACFAIAANRLTLTTLGFLQFIAPTIQFAIGVADGEALTPLRLVSFGFIWAGVLVFAAAALSRGHAERAAARRAAAPA